MVDKLPSDFAGWLDQPDQPAPAAPIPAAAPLPAPQAAAPDFPPEPPRRPIEFGGTPAPVADYPAGVPEPPARPKDVGVQLPPDFAGWLDEKPGLGEVIVEAGKRGLREGIKSANEGMDVVARGGFDQNVHPPEADDSPVGKLLRTPLAEGWKDPNWWAAHIASGITGASPSFATGAAGAAGGSLAAGPAGGLVGGAVGFGAGAALQAVAPAYQRARQEGLDHEAAVDRAIKETGIAGAFGTVMGLAPGGAAFGKTVEGALRRPISEGLLQIFAVQPGLMAGQKASENLVEGKPVMEGVPDAAVLGMATGPVLVGGHALARGAKRAVGLEGKAAEPQTPVDEFLRQADEAEARQRGAATRAEIDEFIRQKEAERNAPKQSGLALPAPDQPAAEPNNQGPVQGGPQDRNNIQPAGPSDRAADIRPDANSNAEPGVVDRGARDTAVAAEDAALRAAGWDAEEIGLMSAKERARELKDAGYEPGADVPTEAPKLDGTRAKPVKVEAPEDIAPARDVVNTEPTPAQAEAGNYRKGHVTFDGLPISIQNPKGSTRSGTDPDGKPWSVEMPGDYGYLKGSVGADKDHVDILLGDKGPNGKVFVVDQTDPKTGKFDEHKLVAGVNSVGEAARLYSKGFSDGSGPSRIGAITEVPTAHLQDWLSKGRRTKPMAPEPAAEEVRPADHPEPVPVPAKDWEAEGRRAYENARERMVPDGLKGEDARAWERGNRAAQAAATKKYLERARRNAENRMPTTLVQFLRGMGGVIDKGGDLKSQDMHKRFIGLISSRGVSLDQAREAAAEAGYLGHDKERAVSETTVSDLIDAIMDHPRYSTEDETQVYEMKEKLAAKKHERKIAARKAEISSFMDEHGLAPDAEAVERAAVLMQENGLSLDEAFERAAMELAHETPEARAALDETTEDGHNEIPWDDWTGPITPYEEGQDAAAGATGGRNQAPRAEGQGADERGAQGADNREPEKPARAGEDEAPAKGREPGDEGEPGGRESEVAPSEDEQHAASRRMENALDAIEIAQESGDAAKVKAAAREAKRVLADTPEPIKALDPEYWGQFQDAIRRMSAKGYKPVMPPEEAAEPTVEPGAEGKPQGRSPALEGDSSSGKSGNDRIRVNAEFLRDAVESPTFRKSGLSGFDAPFQRKVLASVFDNAQDGKVLRAIVETIPVDVVDVLSGGKLSAENFFHDKAVFRDFLAVNGERPVAMGGDAASALVRAVAGASAIGLPSSDIARVSTNGGAASGAGDNHPRSIEQTPIGAQHIIPGAEKIGQGEQAQRKADEGLKPSVPQKGAGGMFDEAETADQLFDAPAKNVVPASEENGWAGLSPEKAKAAQDAVDRVRAAQAAEIDRIKKASEPPRAPASAVEALRDRFLDRDADRFPTIVQARKFALENGFKPVEGLPENKQIEELIEHALVLAAREIVARDPAPFSAFDKLTNLYNSQPRLASRTSTSVAEQAYSTPAPLAYVASRLAGIDKTKTVAEPTAGNGMLVIEADPKKVIANEINDTRAAALREQGFGRVTQEDATRPGQLPKGMDVVIANPPFGAVREGGESKTFSVEGFRTTNIDHAISLNALAAMKPDGRAVLIIGGVKAESLADRQKGYQQQAKRKFFHHLLQKYKVADIFTVSGDLYERQGAGWPVDVIVIDGVGKTERAPLTLEPPPVLKTWGEVKEKLSGAPSKPDGAQDGVSGIRGEEAGPALERPAGPPAPATGGRADAGGGRLAESYPAPVAPERVGAEPDVRQPVDAGSRVVGDEPQPAPRPVRDEPRTARVPDPERGRPVKANEAGQTPYRPASREADSLGTLIPANLRTPAEDSLARVERAHGDVDTYVSGALGYPKSDLRKHFSAEQVDALALALDNIEKGDGFVLGDSTGVGKGRVVAGAIRYAHRKGMVPVFVTEKPDLYGDMWRDLHDIGFDKFLGRPIEMFMTNAGTRVPLDEKAVDWAAAAETARATGEKIPPREGQFSTSQTSDESARKMLDLLGGTFKPDVVFTTYDQMNSVKGSETERRRFLRAIAPRAFLIMDEAHNAGGQGESERGDPTGKAIPRAKVFREALTKAQAVLYSSATYAKSPKVMDLFSRTDMSKAVEKAEMLPALIERGGVPLQQIVSSMLGQSGQYMRRERSFEGVSYDLELAPVDADSYAAFTEGMGKVFRFDQYFSKERKELAAQIAKERGAGNAMDSGTGEIAANSTEFSSIMHNAIGQMVLSIKAKAAADRAVQALRDGEKPVIALASTMEASLTDFADSAGIKPGDAIELDFGDVLRRYLERTRRITLKNPDDTKTHIMIPLKDMEPSTVAMYRDAEKALADIDMSALPISPIDAIRYEIQKAGYSVREITGRDALIDYSTTPPTYAQRAKGEQGSSGKRVTIKQFNDGALDAVILNKSGSTGVSMHAKDTYKDRRRRRMILVQADPNIDTHMQMLGRVHRTGQVIAPAYSQLAADIPAEARPTAVLMRKMASLNANTTASRKSKFTGEAVDFMNKYGDLVAVAVMREEWQLNEALGEPVRLDADEHPNAMARVTGRLTLLRPDKQQELLDRLTNDYKALIARLDAEGKNDLEAKSIDLQAKVLESQVIKAATGTSPFQAEVRLDKVSVKSQGRAMAPAEVFEAVADAADIKPQEGMTFERDLRMIAGAAKVMQQRMIAENVKAAQEHFAKELAALKKDEAKTKLVERNKTQLLRWQNAAAMAYPGNIVTIRLNDQDMPAVVLSFTKSKNVKNPVALGGWYVKLALPDSTRTFETPLSQMRTSLDTAGKGEEDRPVMSPAGYMDTPATLAPMFENARKEGRENRYVFSGNILAAFDQTKGSGQIVNHTMEDGTVRSGILMSRQFSSKDFMENRAIRFKDAAQVLKFLDQFPKGEVTSTDETITIRVGRSAIEFDLPAARGTGGKYYTDATVRAIYDAWEKRGSRMRADVTRPKAQALLDAMMKIDAVFETRENQDAAQAIVNAGGTPKMAQAAPAAVPQEPPDSSWATIARARVAVDRIIRKVLPPGSVRYEIINGDIPIEDYMSLERSGGTAERGATAAYIAGIDKIVQIGTSSRNFVKSAFHELYHGVQDLGLATPREISVLTSPPEVRRLKNFARKSGLNADAMSQIELEAHYAGEFAEALENEREPPRLHSVSMGFFARLYDLFRRIRHLLAGRGFQIPEDVMRRFQSGEMAKRPFWEHGESRLYGEDAQSPFAQARSSPPPERHFAPTTLRQRVADRMERLPSRDDMVESIFDLHRPVQVTQEALADGARIRPEIDPYKAKRLLPGRRAAMQEDFRKDYLEPLVNETVLARLSRQDISLWLYARHAPERNEAMDRIDPNNNGRGSGITDQEAFDIIVRLSREGKGGALRAVEARVAAIRNYIIDTGETSGVLSEDQANELRATYQHYVPFKGWDDPTLAPEDAQDVRVGGGLKVRGAEFRKAFGRTTIAGDPLATLINDAYRMIDRATKNDALRASWRFMKGLSKEATEGVLRLDKGKMIKAVDPTTGMMRWQEEPGWRFRENVVPLKIGGKPHYIVFDDPVIAQAWMRLTPEQLHWTLSWMGPIINTAKNFWTHYRPDFIFRHFFMRYPIEGALNAGEGGARAMVKSFRSYPMGPAFRAIRAHALLDAGEREALMAKVSRGDATPQEREMAYYEEMRQAGGLMRWSDFGGVERIKRQIDRATADLETRPDRAFLAHARALHEGLDHVLGAMDNAQRLQAYIQAREAGASKVDAAMAAREATVDFALKGRIANYLNLIWPFANTAGQTASRAFRAVKRSPAMMLKVLAGVTVAGFAAGLYAYLMGGSDEDGTPYIEKIGDWTKRLNMVIPVPGMKDDKGRPYMLTISLPYNYAFPFVFGQTAAALTMKGAGVAKVKLSELTHNLFHSALEATTPIAQENSMIGKFTPELMRPFLHVGMNQNWYGGPVHPSEEPWNKGIPKSERSFGSTGAAWKKLAETMHKYGGPDFHPEDYREVLSYFTSTMQGDVARVQTAISDVMAGEKPSPTDIPVLHTMFAGGKQYDQADRRAYYDKRGESLSAATRAKGLQKRAVETGEGVDGARDYAQKHAREIAAAKQFRSTDGSRAALTKQMRRIEADTTIPADEKRRRLQFLRDKELQMMQRLREQTEQ